ncbi:MAG: metalloregulator ArsR/SmtB family transcription factor [Desulfobulbaceae bacterium]|jgi:ArsR family transcriptional regulator|nr:metalloregulator ArsR/SmtB family transcription factor [Desulfobulbaceae bacterium]
MLDFVAVSKSLTDENRLRILMALREREMCVCQITGFLDLSPSTTSKHLSILRQARLIVSRKRGKWVYYRLADQEKSPPLIHAALAWTIDALQDNAAIAADRQRIADILRLEEEICQDDNHDHFHSLEIHSLEENP